MPKISEDTLKKVFQTALSARELIALLGRHPDLEAAQREAFRQELWERRGTAEMEDPDEAQAIVRFFEEFPSWWQEQKQEMQADLKRGNVAARKIWFAIDWTDEEWRETVSILDLKGGLLKDSLLRRTQTPEWVVLRLIEKAGLLSLQTSMLVHGHHLSVRQEILTKFKSKASDNWKERPMDYPDILWSLANHAAKVGANYTELGEWCAEIMRKLGPGEENLPTWTPGTTLLPTKPEDVRDFAKACLLSPEKHVRIWGNTILGRAQETSRKIH